jgi:hypothetical protein
LEEGLFVTTALWFSVRLDYRVVILDSAERADRIGAVLARPCFATLKRVSSRAGDRWDHYANTTSETVAAYLRDPKNESVCFDSGAGRAVTASGQIQNGTYPVRKPGASPTMFFAYLAFPIATDVAECIDALCTLASALDVSAGYIAIEPTYSRAQELALGFRLPREREGLSPQRRRERRGRDWHSDQIARELSGIEWGTFLGPGHLAEGRVDLSAVNASGAFDRVVEVVPERLVYLQVTTNPADDLEAAIETKLIAARKAVSSVVMETNDVELE